MNISNKKFAEEAIELFSYRGPDSTGVFTDDKVTLAFKRLAIIDLDPRSDQPMCDANSSARIVFNGEIYNYLELKSTLSSSYSFQTDSDTEVLLAAYRKWGKDMVTHIKGMYAFCIYDSQKQKLFLARDYSGIKPLYYYHHERTFLFASELKGIIRLLRRLGRAVEINTSALDFFYTLGYIPSPETLYTHVYKLSPRATMEYDLNSDVLTHQSVDIVPTPAHGLDSFMDLLEKKVLEHLQADVPVGLFFSGGTDSAMIASILQKHQVQLENFSIRMSHKAEDEHFFTNISRHLGITSHVYDFGVEQFDEVYPQVMGRLDEPFVDDSLFPTFYISQKAAQQVKVVLSGEGGDEYFYGYERHRVLYKLREYSDYVMSWLDRLYFALPYFRYKTTLFKRLFAWNHQPMSYYLAQMTVGKDIVSWKRCKQEFATRKLTPLDLDKMLYLENILLRKTDLATSYNSIEGRVPLLAVDVIQNTDQFEAEKLNHGQLKSVLKQLLNRYLPKELVFRNKSGFGANLSEKFQQSSQLRHDFQVAVAFLAERELLPDTFDTRNTERYMHRYPKFCFSLIVLYYCLRNSA